MIEWNTVIITSIISVGISLLVGLFIKFYAKPDIEKVCKYEKNIIYFNKNTQKL